MEIEAMTLKEIWHEIDRRANEHPELLKDMDASYSFHITGNDSGQYGLIFKDNTARIVPGGIDDADCMMTMGIDHFKKLITGNLNATTAYMTGRIKVKGNLGHGLKLENLLKKFPVS